MDYIWMFFIEKEIMSYAIWESLGMVSKLGAGIVTSNGFFNIFTIKKERVIFRRIPLCFYQII